MEHETSVGRVVLGGAAAAAALATAFGMGAAVLEPTSSQARVRAVTPAGDLPASVDTSADAPRRHPAKATTTQKRLKASAARSARAAHTVPARASRSARRAAAVRHPRAVGRQMAAARYGWHTHQFSCLRSLWQKESGWNHRAGNRSGAYGIPQALPGSKMRSKGADWRTNPVTQIAWGLSYVNGRYHSPCRAWAHSRATGWY